MRHLATHSAAVAMLALCGLAAVARAGEEQAAPLHLSVDDCAALAMAENPQAGIAVERIIQAEARAEQARAGLRPQAGASVNYGYISGLEVDVGGGLADRIGNIGVLRPEKYLVVGRVGVEQVLYAGGSLRAAIRAADALAVSETHQQAVTLALLAFEARTAFHDVLLAEALVEVAEESIAAVALHKADAEQLADAGLISGFETLRAETELAAREAALVSAQTIRDMALLQLKRMIGVAQGQAVALTGELSWAPLDENLDELVARARVKRPELLALDAAAEAAEHQIAARRGAFRPRAGASVDYQRFDGGTAFNPDGFTVNLMAEWDFYAGGRRRAEVREAESEARMLAFRRQEAEDLVELDVRGAYRQVEEAIVKIQQEEKTVALGEESLRLAHLRFQQGAGRQADTVDAELALTQARTARVQALRDYAVARTALDRAVGRLGN